MSARESDDAAWYARHAPMGNRLAVLADAGDNPEELLLQAEEERARARKALRALPEKDRRTLVQAQGMSQRKVAAVEGVSHTAIQKRVKAARLKYAWYVGAGALFSGIDIHRDLWWRLPTLETRFLIILWREKSIIAASESLGLPAKRLFEIYRGIMATALPRLVAEDPSRYSKYLRGFAALREAVQHGLFSRGVRDEPTKKTRSGKK